MNNQFSRILTMLRKERGLTQKEAASELGVSQALLSHYENGVRECGLDFLIRAADFYRVSCDYILGRTPDRTGSTITFKQPSGKEAPRSSVHPDKQVVLHSLNIIFSLLMQAGNDTVSDNAVMIIMTAIYRVLRMLHGGNQKNPKDMFTVSRSMYAAAAQSCSALAEASGCKAAGRLKADKDNLLLISHERLAEGYPIYAPRLMQLIDTVERRMQAVISAEQA
jgi:transcriptional regulator with XRE-family HTH domain